MRVSAVLSLLSLLSSAVACGDPVVLAPTTLPVGAVVVSAMSGGFDCPALAVHSTSTSLEEMTVRQNGPHGPVAVSIRIVEDRSATTSPDGEEKEVSAAEGVSFDSTFEHGVWQRKGAFNGEVHNALNSWTSPAPLDLEGEYPAGEVRRSFRSAAKLQELTTDTECKVGRQAKRDGRPTVELMCEGTGTYFMDGQSLQITALKAWVVRDLGYRLSLRDDTTATLALPDGSKCTLMGSMTSRVTAP